ncbi:hypothetical protein NHF39_25000 [Pseudomonas proteolytica]|nr:hypothetical protein NHF39_25000 [Pseudomonas proteolytica]
MPDSKPKVVELPAPVLVEAQGQSQVDSLKLLEGATVRACYDGMSEKDQLVLWWVTTSGNYVDIGTLQGVAAGCVDFHVPPEYVGMRLDNYALFLLQRDSGRAAASSFRARRGTNQFALQPASTAGATGLPWYLGPWPVVL